MNVFNVRVRGAWGGRGVTTERCCADPNGTVRIYDSVAGYYTTCHQIGARAQARIRKLAAKATA